MRDGLFVHSVAQRRQVHGYDEEASGHCALARESRWESLVAIAGMCSLFPSSF